MTINFDYENPPLRSKEELYSTYNKKMFLIMEDVLSTKEAYRMIFQDLLDIMKYGFEIPEVRHQIQRFKIHAKDRKIYGLPRNNFISNMVLWKYFLDTGNVDEMDETYIFNFIGYDTNRLVDFIDDKILANHEGDFTSKNLTSADICDTFSAISRMTTPIMGLSVSDYDIMQIEKRNPRVTELMYTPLDPNAQPHEVEEDTNNRIREFIDIVKNDSEYNHFKPMYAAGKVLNVNQSKEVFIRIGMKADIDGHTIPYPIDSNFLISGLSTASAYYINNLSGRKAGILSKTQMSDPGTFSKQINWIAASPSILRKDYEMCDSVRPLFYNIKDETFLRLLNNRYYYDEDGEMKLLNEKKDKHLIGKMVPFRSPCTCNSKEGICKYCYGELFDINHDLFSTGSLAAIKEGEPLGQSTLGLKHTQQTVSSEIVLGEDFSKTFDLMNGEVTLSETSEYGDTIYIRLGMVTFEETDDNEFYYCNSFDLVTKDGEVLSHIEEQNGANLYLSDTLISLYKKAKDKTLPISLENLDETDVLFNIEVGNKEVMSSLKALKSILNSGSKSGLTLDEICQKFAETLINCGIEYDLVHAEAIIRGMVRKKTNVTEYPDWGRNDDHNNYQVATMLTSIKNNPSPLIRLCTGFMKKHLTSAAFYNAHAPSHIDPLFVDVLADYI